LLPRQSMQGLYSNTEQHLCFNSQVLKFQTCVAVELRRYVSPQPLSPAMACCSIYLLSNH
jgi:hypothetical protein